MKKVLITEFMEQDSVDKMSKHFEVTYDTTLHENLDNLNFSNSGYRCCHCSKQDTAE